MVLAGRRSFAAGLTVLIIAAWPGQPAAAQALDPHLIYEERCARCHTAHAGIFVHERLVRSDGSLIVRKTSKDLRSFFGAGHGKLSLEEIDVLVRHFENVLNSGRLFQEKCRACHDRAVDLARLNLIIRDGRLIGRYTGRDIAEFLLGHGRLQEDEVEKMIAVLRRQLR